MIYINENSWVDLTKKQGKNKQNIMTFDKINADDKTIKCCCDMQKIWCVKCRLSLTV